MSVTKLGLARLVVSVLTLAFCHSPAWAQSKPAGELAWKFEYGDADRLVKTVDPAGRATQFQYSFDETKRLRKIVRMCDDGSNVTREFDAFGRLTRMTDGAGTVSYGYDDLGRLNHVQRQGTHVITYSHDTLDRIASIQVGDLYRIDYSYDFLGRLASMKTPAGLVTYEYQTGLGQVVRSLPNGVKTFWKRQPNGELEEITHGFFKNPDDKKYSVLAQYTYQHGPDGRIAAIRERSGQVDFVRRYGYDKMGHLTDATGPNGRVYHYEYDSVGNRTKATASGCPDQVCTYDWAGRLTTAEGKACEHDPNGNLTEVALEGATTRYGYHADGRLAEVRAKGETIRFTYDGQGRLILRKDAKGETGFLPDPLSAYWQPLVVKESGDSRTLIIWDGSVPLALVRGGQVEWLLHDHLGSVRTVVGVKGEVNRRAGFDPYGSSDEGFLDQRTISIGFAGLFWDPQAQAYLTFARALLPEVGGFCQPEPSKHIPAELKQHFSLFAYCGGDPVNLIDKDGAEPVNFDSHERWWDSFGRTFSYHTVGAPVRWLYKAFGGKPAELSLNLDPVERNSTISSVVREAQQRVGSDPTALHSLLNNWRQNPSQRPQEFRYSVTDHEWKVIENAAYRDQLASRSMRDVLINDGHLPARIVETFTDRDARAPDWLIRAGTLKWESAHRLGELTGLPPSFFEPRAGGPWLTTTSSTKKAYERGLGYWVEQNPGVVSQARASKPIWRQVDDFICPPAYGDDIGNPRPLRTSPVGGVYLGGAGGTIVGLGVIKGVRTDANGNLVLVGEDAGDIKLPPLRLDDVITVFRSVYLNGEGPTVTIDPNPENPEKSAMIIRHSKATEDTYVGWILYQADRLMKSYTQGVDNKTEKDVVSRVPGYAGVLETIYFGADDPRKSQKEGIWERFWIVPAAAHRYEGSRRELTMFDVPLKVKTQKMKWMKHKLEDDLTGKSSPGARAFTEWFTRNYDGISSEQYLLPPAESGISNPVPVFAELRQIALMTAVAEKLCEQGVPMPFWMRDYEVRKVPFEHFTPGMEVKRTRTDGNGIQTARIFGGVEMSAETKAVKTYATPADVANARSELRAEVERNYSLAEHLEQAIGQKVLPSGSAPLSVKQFSADKRNFRAVSFPGAQTLALGPKVLVETDLVVPFAGNRAIRLDRRFNSFFNPKGNLGRGWTMDLPQLQEIRIPGERGGNKATYTTAYELLTPLNEFYTRFKEVRAVDALGGAKLQTPDAEGPFYGIGEERPKFLKNAETLVVYLKNGQEWHFTRNGDFVAVRDGPQTTVYERSEGRVSRIGALMGGVLAASIALEYSSQGLLTKAVGRPNDQPDQKPVEVSYAYDAEGRLIAVTFPEGSIGYKYKGPWVELVTWTEGKPGAQPETLRKFEYNERGQMVSEDLGSRVVRYGIAAAPEGVEATVEEAGSGVPKTMASYDAQMRPVKENSADGTQTTWAYSPDGIVEKTVVTSDKQRVVVTDSADRRQRSVTVGDRPALVARFDAGGHLTSLAENQKVLLTQQWRADGQLAEAETDTSGTSLQYDDQGVLTSVRVHPPKGGERLSQWQETKVDRFGNPIEIRDHSGLEIHANYDSSGRLAGVVQQRPEGNLGYRIERDREGRLQGIKSSWGEASYGYAADGKLQHIESKRGGRSASLELSRGLVRKATGFDGGVLEVVYVDKGQPVVSEIQAPNGLTLKYDYDAGRLAGVDCGIFRIRGAHDVEGRVTDLAYQKGASGAPPPGKPEWMAQFASLYRQLTAPAREGEAPKDFIGQKVGAFRILAVHKSFTDTRVCEVEGPDGISMLKLHKRSEESQQETRLNLELSDQLAQKGFAVAKALLIEGEPRLLCENCIVTREAMAAGRSMADRPLTPVELESYGRLALRLFQQGEIKPEWEVKPAARTEEEMREKLSRRNERGRRFFRGLKSSGCQQAKLAGPVLGDADVFHDRFDALLKVLFQNGNLRHSGLVHDNILRNYFIEGRKITTFDFGSDYVGNLGNVFSELARSIFWLETSDHGPEDFGKCFEQLTRLYTDTTRETLSEADVHEVLRCMLMTPYLHSSSDSKLLVNELKAKFGLELLDASDDLLWAKLASPDNQQEIEKLMGEYEPRYLQNMQQLHLTLKLLLEHTSSVAERQAIQGFLPILESILRAKVRVVLDEVHPTIVENLA